MTFFSLSLNSNWEWKQRNSNIDVNLDASVSLSSDSTIAVDNLASAWYPVTRFPSMIHTELLAYNVIPDPYEGVNENEVQWIGEKDWMYRCKFSLPDNFEGKSAVLAFDGLDTFATVYVNGVEVGKTENMFLRYRIEVLSEHLKVGEQNELVLVFESAWFKAKTIEKEHGARNKWNGDSSRLYIRKAQYHYGWDWGPVLMTCGPWRAVRIEIFESRISDVYVTSEILKSHSGADLTVVVTVESPFSGQKVEIIISSPSDTVIAKVSASVINGQAMSIIHVSNPEIWWPLGYGKQSLYKISATLVGEQDLHTVEKNFGIRKCKLVQRPLLDQPGTSFFFEINHKRIFGGGANWIPADSLITRISDERYEAWIKLMADGNFSMVRVWGGGVYESDLFYDLCDKYGLMVFQDFMFACGSYPAHDAFLKLVQDEAEDNVKRLRNHPSIVIWTGNNEDYAVAESTGLSMQSTFDAFPNRKIYEDVLQNTIKRLCPDVDYQPGSPYGGKATDDATIGDVHQWNVWHGSQKPYQQYCDLGARFVSEFGMQGHPHLATVAKYFGSNSDDEKYPQSYTMDHHNKASGGDRRIGIYIVENIKTDLCDLTEFVYASQIMQAEALFWAVRDWRREWKGENREYCSGALIWQVNDCWPVTSWAMVDYYLRPKPAYFSVKRALARTSINIVRKRTSPRFTAGESPADTDINTSIMTASTTHPHKVHIWVSSFDEINNAKIFIRAFTLSGALKQQWEFEVPDISNASVDISQIALPVDEEVVVAAWLVSDLGSTVSEVDGIGPVVARAIDWPQPLKYAKIQTDTAVVAVVNENILEISANKPVKGVILDATDRVDTVKWDDNAFDLVPGEKVFIKFIGSIGPVTGKWLGITGEKVLL
ncbi:hypothetical protein HK096_011578 [Nowakowskiella sp. JEL0078]|nr:hypothetical protein HK096_011578 [Nowakowskiella sp. JEL0078]